MTIQDTFRGSMNQDWRLDIQPPARLGHVVDHGVDQVITRAQGQEGVELRQSDVDLVAESRIDDVGGELAAVGWSTDVTGLVANLHLPPGWSLFAISGTDGGARTTVDLWSLFDLFFVLMVAIAAWRLLGWQWGLVALVALSLSRHDGSAPEWLWPILLALAALLRVVPGTGLARNVFKWLRICFLAILFVMLLHYGVKQVRIAFAPVLERAWVSAGAPVEYGGEVLGAGERAPVPERKEAPRAKRYLQRATPSARQPGGKVRSLEYDLLEASMGSLSNVSVKQSLQQDPSAVVQTGPGIPGWRWDTHTLHWSGSVAADHHVRMYLIGPRLNGAIILLKVALLLLLALRFAETAWWKRRPSSGTGTALVLAAGLGVLAAGAVHPSRAAAGEADQVSASGESGLLVPGPAVLRDLEQRLTRPPECQPHCLSVSLVHVVVGEERLKVIAEVHADADGAWPLPGPAAVWVPGRVTLEGRATTALARLPDGFLHVRVPLGVTTLIAEGPLPPTDALTLRFGVLPQRLTWASEAWTVDGVHADGTVDRAIQLTRVMKSGTNAKATSTENLAPWVRVHRTLDLGIPWQVLTTVTRVGPSTTPLALRIPLLEGEAVMDERLEVRDDAVQVALDRDQSEVSWQSSLEQRDEIVLEAPEGVIWNERWTVLCSPVFSCHAKGLTPLRHVAGGRWAPEWWPWAGESVTVTIARPEAVPGQTVTIDSAELSYTPGKRTSEASLTLSIRSSQGGQQTIGLPAGSRLQSVKVNDKPVPVQAARGEVPVPIQPGRQSVVLEWQQSKPQDLVERAPRVDAGSPGVNISVVMKVPQDRWLLWLEGPDWGPVPLFWSLVIIVLIAAPILRRVPYTSLRTWQWALLGLGMVPASAFAPLAVVVWFAALGYRREKPPSRWWTFNLYQLVLVGTTLVALAALYVSIQQGLLGDAPANIAGNGSSRTQLAWYVDRMDGVLPQPAVWSVPIWVWRVLMLAWSLWLAWSLVRWLPEAWQAFAGGGWWRKGGKRPPGGGKTQPQRQPGGGVRPR